MSFKLILITRVDNIVKVLCDYIPDTKSGTPGADSIKVKGNIHWLSTKYALNAEVFLYDRLFMSEQPGSKSNNYLDDINPNSIALLPPETC